jgi:hypothetical protein
VGAPCRVRAGAAGPRRAAGTPPPGCRGPGVRRGERDFDKTRWRGGCAALGLGRETSAQMRVLAPELLRHPRRRQHGSERHGWCPQGLGNVSPSLGAGLPPVLKLSSELIELVFSL